VPFEALDRPAEPGDLRPLI